jgi:hypothetical protein
MNQVQIAQAGGTVGSGGANTISFAGSGLYYGQTSTTYAGIVANNTQGADVTGGAAATITAHSGGMDVGVTGSIITGDGSSTGVGFSVTVDNIQRSTVAFIGADPSGNAHTVPTAASTLDFGDVKISATTGVATLSDGSTAPGLIIGIAVAGTSTTGQFGQSPDDPTKSLTLPANFDQVDGTTGAGLAGGVAINVINDTTLAYMNASGTATTGKLALAGTNNQTMVNISGGVALAFSGKVQNSGGTSIAGAFSLNQTTSDTEAFLKGITLTSTAAAAAGSDQVSLSALMEGIISSGSASLSAGNTDQGKNYALSVSVNRVVDTTDAVMDDVTVTQAGNVGLDAMNSAQIIAVGGGCGIERLPRRCRSARLQPDCGRYGGRHSRHRPAIRDRDERRPHHRCRERQRHQRDRRLGRSGDRTGQQRHRPHGRNQHHRQQPIGVRSGQRRCDYRRNQQCRRHRRPQRDDHGHRQFGDPIDRRRVRNRAPPMSPATPA